MTIPDVRLQYLNSKEFFYLTIPDVRAGYGLDEKATFLKCKAVVKSQGATVDAFKDFEEFDKWLRDMIQAKKADNWNQPKINYQDKTLTLEEKRKARFDYFVKGMENIAGWPKPYAFDKVHNSNFNVFRNFDEYLNYLKNQ